ncbi:primase 1D-like protein [Sulfuriferula multivorans]|uniref:primase 1D-like protein n=1 Tax=Sulfuriferula multivorans TaxID=1559896 RepID=UPI0026B430D8
MATDINHNLHPLGFLGELRARAGENIVLNFSKYSYRRRERRDERVSFAVPICEVTPKWLLSQLKGLQPYQELAIESRVQVNGLRRHIPMLDFHGMRKGQLLAIMEVFPDYYAEGMQVYFSGRSFHAYFPHLLTSRQWVKFMGSALLCNTPSSDVIDQRWVGHRLIGGYAALRWSNNTPQHSHYPTRIDLKMLDLPFSEKSKLLHVGRS